MPDANLRDDDRKRAWVRWWWRTWLIVVVALSLLHLFSAWFPLSQGSPSSAAQALVAAKFLILLAFLPVGAAGFVVAPVSPILMWRSAGKLRREYAYLLLVALVAFGMVFGNIYLGLHLRQTAFRILAVRSKPLIAAIHQYDRDHGHQPAKLTDLVPKYLHAYPHPGIRAYPTYHYRAFSRSLVYYNLGKHGRSFDRSMIRHGPPDQGVLVAYLDGRGVVMRAETRRLPNRSGFPLFYKQRWRESPKDRASMATDLVRRRLLIGKTTPELSRLLGPHSGRRKLPHERWELRVPCGRGLSFDVFIYRPSKRYDGRKLSGHVERMGDWAYVWE